MAAIRDNPGSASGASAASATTAAAGAGAAAVAAAVSTTTVPAFFVWTHSVLVCMAVLLMLSRF